MAFALAGARIFDGARFLDRHAVVINGRRIAAVVPVSGIPASASVIDLHGGLLAPGFIDVQVNGGGGVLFNAEPAIDGVRCIADSHRKFGTTGMLPTVITDAPEVTPLAIAAVREARRQGSANILGIHVEGPFLDAGRKGAHDERFIRTMTDKDVEQLAHADCGRLMLTVAPNRVPPEYITRLANAGICVSLGHAEATAREALAALRAGATAFTHVFNAMSQLTGREPGMVGAALADRRSFCGLIADGLHVHDTAMKVVMAAKPKDRIMLVTDAMPPAAGGPDSFELQGRIATRKNGRLELPDGTLAGSNLTMDAAVRYCVNVLGVSLEDALRMASLSPATFLGLDDSLGMIAPDYIASLVHLGDDLTVQRTWVEGT
jgi:N-acetylglucosamine-6-phosphate deacetylase